MPVGVDDGAGTGKVTSTVVEAAPVDAITAAASDVEVA